MVYHWIALMLSDFIVFSLTSQCDCIGSFFVKFVGLHCLLLVLSEDTRSRHRLDRDNFTFV